jgi:hypothetical protein
MNDELKAGQKAEVRSRKSEAGSQNSGAGIKRAPAFLLTPEFCFLSSTSFFRVPTSAFLKSRDGRSSPVGTVFV